MSDFDDAWRSFEEEAGPVLANALADAAPVVTGELRDSMTWDDQDGVLTAGSQDARGPIAKFVARGTSGPYWITPLYANALHFFVDGDEVFTQAVLHPGIEANPFHLVAWEASRDEVLALFRERVGHGALRQLNPWRVRTV